LLPQDELFLCESNFDDFQVGKFELFCVFKKLSRSLLATRSGLFKNLAKRLSSFNVKFTCKLQSVAQRAALWSLSGATGSYNYFLIPEIINAIKNTAIEITIVPIDFNMSPMINKKTDPISVYPRRGLGVRTVFVV